MARLATALTQDATGVVVTAAQFRAHINQLSDHDDAYIDDLIGEVTAQVETHTHRTILERSYLMTFDGFDDPFKLALGNGRKVTSVQYRNRDNVLTSVPLASLYIRYHKDGITIDRMRDYVWPGDLTVTHPARVQIEATFGWLNAADVPKDIVRAIKFIAGQAYEFREDPPRLSSLLRPSEALLYPWVIRAPTG